jgi:hypothetical protein
MRILIPTTLPRERSIQNFIAHYTSLLTPSLITLGPPHMHSQDTGPREHVFEAGDHHFFSVRTKSIIDASSRSSMVHGAAGLVMQGGAGMVWYGRGGPKLRRAGS